MSRLQPSVEADFIPTLIELDGTTYGLMVVGLKACPKCQRYMVAAYIPKGMWHSVFPLFYKINFPEQVRRAGWVIESDVQVDNKYICKDCEKAGLADFECSLCRQRKPTSKIEERFGDPPDFLCSDCYESVTAKVWDDAVKDLREEHRYDYE